MGQIRNKVPKNNRDEEQREFIMVQKINHAFRDFVSKAVQQATDYGVSLTFEAPYQDLQFRGIFMPLFSLTIGKEI